MDGQGPSRWTAVRRKRKLVGGHQLLHGGPEMANAALDQQAEGLDQQGENLDQQADFEHPADGYELQADNLQIADEDNSQADIFSSDEDNDDLQMNYLIEDPDQHDPDDPDEPGIPDSSSSSSSEEEIEEEEGHFSIEDASLDTLVHEGGHSRREILLLNLAVASKNNATYEMLIDMFRSWNVGLSRPGMMPPNKKKLRKLLKRSDAGLCKYAYCPSADCKAYLGRYKTLVALGEPVPCNCGRIVPINQLRWFVSLNLKKQLEQFLTTPNIVNLLKYRTTRVKINEDAIEDVFDGDLYKELIARGVIINDDNNCTYVMNTDGFALFNQNLSVWVLLLRINELPPVLRQRHLFLGGIWVDKHKPNMNAFLKPFVKQLNTLSRQGINWTSNNIQINTKLYPLACCCDAQARCILMNMKQYNGEYGCFLCNHKGVQLGGSGKYPLLPHDNLPPAEDRTDQSIRDSMMRGEPFEGQSGPSQMMLLNHFDLARGSGLDDLHVFYEGVASFCFELLIPLMDDEGECLRLIDFRMRSVRSPTSIARKWKSVTKRGTWKGSQWGTFIRYFAVVCLVENNLNEFYVEMISLLSYSLFILSRDSFTDEDLDRVEAYVLRFLHQFQDTFGPVNMRANIHFLSHAVKSVRYLGPTWAISCFNFESWNRRLGSRVTSPKGVFDQMVDRHFLKILLHQSVLRNDISDQVREELKHLLFASEREISEDVDSVVLLGHGKTRIVLPEEQRLLLEEGINCERVVEFDRVLVHGVEYRTKTYHDQSLSDNSNAFTKDDKFITINGIIKVANNGEEVCRILVEEHMVDYPLYFAHHVAHLTGYQTKYMDPKKLRVLATRMSALNETYIVPMASPWEID